MQFCKRNSWSEFAFVVLSDCKPCTLSLTRSRQRKQFIWCDVSGIAILSAHASAFFRRKVMSDVPTLPQLLASRGESWSGQSILLPVKRSSCEWYNFVGSSLSFIDGSQYGRLELICSQTKMDINAPLFTGQSFFITSLFMEFPTLMEREVRWRDTTKLMWLACR